MVSLASRPIPSTLGDVYRRHIDLQCEVDSAKRQLRLLRSMIDDDACAYEVNMPSILSEHETDTYFCILQQSDTSVVFGFCLVDWPPLVAMASEMGLREHVTVGSGDPAIPCSACHVVAAIRAAIDKGTKMQWAGGARVPLCSRLS
jgi:hypothetical protein